MYKYHGKNTRPFTAVCGCKFGREVIYTNKNVVDASNICDELAHALPIHEQNAREIEYLNNYYEGDQPILYRQKVNRPEVNNRIVENLAFMLVETKTAEMAGEPIQYVLSGSEEGKAEAIVELNKIMAALNKPKQDIDLCRWRSICGTAYRYVGKKLHPRLMDEYDIRIPTEDPRTTFVVYYNDGEPAFSCQIRDDENGETIYCCYTASYAFTIKNSKIVQTEVNGNGAIPVVEYPNNERRLSDIEITISITDEISKMASERSNGVEQFVSSWVKFVNCEIDREKYREMRQEGALVVKSNNGSDNKADVDILTSELNQSETQVVVADLFDKFLVIQGMANREGNTGGDTGSAVMMRNGFYSMEKRSELNEPIFIDSEDLFLRLVLNRLRIEKKFNLNPSDVEVKISRTKMDNLYTKAESLQMLLNSGVNPARALKTVNIWNDPERVATESQDRMDILYPTEKEEVVIADNKPPVEEEEDDGNDKN